MFDANSHLKFSAQESIPIWLQDSLLSRHTSTSITVVPALELFHREEPTGTVRVGSWIEFGGLGTVCHCRPLSYGFHSG